MAERLIGSTAAAMASAQAAVTANCTAERASGLPVSETVVPARVIWIAQKTAQTTVRRSPTVNAERWEMAAGQKIDAADSHQRTRPDDPMWGTAQEEYGNERHEHDIEAGDEAGIRHRCRLQAHLLRGCAAEKGKAGQDIEFCMARACLHLCFASFEDNERQHGQCGDGETQGDEPEGTDRLHCRRLRDEAAAPDGGCKQQEKVRLNARHVDPRSGREICPSG